MLNRSQNVCQGGTEAWGESLAVVSMGASGPFFLIDSIAFFVEALLLRPSVENNMSVLYLKRASLVLIDFELVRHDA